MRMTSRHGDRCALARSGHLVVIQRSQHGRRTLRWRPERARFSRGDGERASSRCPPGARAESLLRGYDPVVDEVDALDEELEQLRAVARHRRRDRGGDRSRGDVGSQARKKLVELFKSDNALLQNSLTCSIGTVSA